MTRQEFTEALRARLARELSPAEVAAHVQYYQGYIDGEVHRGKTEEEAVDELGDPALIAKTLMDAPRETNIFGDPVAQDAGDAYEEGAYQGENELPEETIREHAEEGTAAGELKKDLDEARETAKEKREQLEKEAKEKREQLEEAAKEKREQLEKTPQDSPFRNEDGGFNWALFGVILAAVMIVVAVIWLVGKIVSALGPALLIIIAIILILYTIYYTSRKHEG